MLPDHLVLMIRFIHFLEIKLSPVGFQPPHLAIGQWVDVYDRGLVLVKILNLKTSSNPTRINPDICTCSPCPLV